MEKTDSEETEDDYEEYRRGMLDTEEREEYDEYREEEVEPEEEYF